MDELYEALQLLKEYCEDHNCYSCMLYKSETGCFFRYHDILPPHKWEPDELYQEDDDE